MKGDRQKELERLKGEAAVSALSQQALTQKLDKVSARRSILEQEVLDTLHSFSHWVLPSRQSHFVALLLQFSSCCQASQPFFWEKMQQCCTACSFGAWPCLQCLS